MPTDDQVTNALNKFKNHLCIVMINIKKKNDQTFSFNFAKVFPKSDILTNKNSDYFAECFYENVTSCIPKSIILSGLTLADVHSVYKKSPKTPKITMSQLAYYPVFPKFTKDVSMMKFSSFLILYCPNIHQGLVAATTYNTAR